MTQKFALALNQKHFRYLSYHLFSRLKSSICKCGVGLKTVRGFLRFDWWTRIPVSGVSQSLNPIPAEGGLFQQEPCKPWVSPAVRAMQTLVSLPWGHVFSLNKGSPEPLFLDLTFDDVGNLFMFEDSHLRSPRTLKDTLSVID